MNQHGGKTVLFWGRSWKSPLEVRTPEEVSQAKKQYEQKSPWLRYDEHEQMMFSGKNIFDLVYTDSV
jgi:hypothetical protein